MFPYLSIAFYLGSWIRTAAALSFNLTNFHGQLDDSSGVLKSLIPTSDLTFDFSILGDFDLRNGDGNYHTGDVDLRYRTDNQSAWTVASTATNRSNPGQQLSAASSSSSIDGAISVWDLSSVFEGSGLNVTRTWTQYDGNVVLSLNLTNTLPDASVEVGGLGFPLEVDNIFTDKTAVEAMENCSLIDPYIGLNAGYAAVRRLNGLGPNMLITPFTATTSFEAWNFLVEDTTTSLAYQSTDYEGNYEWLVHTAAFAEDEWAGVEPWNEPTSVVLEPGEFASYGFLFTIVPSVQEFDSHIASLDIPVAVGVPGYILPKETVGSLYLNSSLQVLAIDVYPEGFLTISDIANAPSAPWIGYAVTPSADAFGRARVTISWSNNANQTVHYWIAEDTATSIENVGKFIMTNQWFTNTSDPFGRAPSIISYDLETDDFVLDDNRVWIAGLSDEGGSGSYVAYALKQVFQPVSSQVQQLETYVNETYWGHVQHSSGNETYGVKKSVFYYDTSIDWNYSPAYDWDGAWDEAEADLIDRAYDYVWTSILYWSLYAADRVSPGILTFQDPIWYLKQAYETVYYVLNSGTVGYVDYGLMGESMWGHLLQSLYYENMTAEASSLIPLLRERLTTWSEEADPFGSEQPWDCTGQEGIYYWSQYFNDTATALRTIESIHGYDPVAAHWGWNGNARRYWDFTTAGNPNTSRIERQIHHYGSSLNSIALLDYFRRSAEPQSLDSLYDLRLGYAGHMASLSNIGQTGFGSMAFHSYPYTLAWDTYTGDYGPNFVGHYQTSASYLAQHPEFGWITFGGNIDSSSSSTTNITVTPLDSLRRRVYIAPIGLFVMFEAGQIQSYTWSVDQNTLDVVVASSSNATQNVVMYFEQTSAVLASGAVVLDTPGLQDTVTGGYYVEIPAGGTTSLRWSVNSS